MWKEREKNQQDSWGRVDSKYWKEGEEDDYSQPLELFTETTYLFILMHS